MSKSISLSAIRNYLGSNIIITLVPLIFIPILARYLSVEDYAKVAIFMAASKFFSIVADINLSAYLPRAYFEFDNNEFKQYLIICIGSLLTFSSLWLFSITLLADSISEIVKLKMEYVVLALISGSASILIKLRLTQWQVREKSSNYSIFQIVQSICFIISITFLVVLMLMEAKGRIYAELFVLSLFAAYSLWSFHNEGLLVSFKFDLQKIRNILNYSIPLLPHVLGIFTLSFADRFIVTSQLGLTEATNFIMAIQMAMVLGLINDAINKTYVPWFYKSLTSKTNEEQIKNYRNKYSLFLLTVSVISFFIPPKIFIFILGDKYIQVASIFPLIIIGQALNGLYLYYANYLLFFKKNIYMSIITIFCGITYILTLTFFSESWGLIGAGLAFIFTMFIRLMLTGFVSTYFFKYVGDK